VANGSDIAPAGTDASGPCLADPLQEAMRLIAAGEEAGIPFRATGGVGIALICPSARRPPLARHYQDIDFVARAKHARGISQLMVELGYIPEEEFNVLHGQHRLFFLDSEHQRQFDIFLDAIEMCHRLDLRTRAEILEHTLTPADLLLSKLQVVNTNQKDYKDATAVLADHDITADDTGININRLNELCAADWGWWRTVTMVAERTHKFVRELAQGPHGESLRHVADRTRHLIAELERAPKSRRWKMRARVGDRMRWHEDPEDLEHA
jgi:Uncharacterised nucleotidyltransferase